MKRINPFEDDRMRLCPFNPVDPPCLPPELIQSVISFLDFSERRSSLEVSKIWNAAIYEQGKLEKLADYQMFLEVVLEHLDLEYTAQRATILALLIESRKCALTAPVFPVGCMTIRKTNDEIDAKIRGSIPNLEEVFLSLLPEDLDAVFDGFQGKGKPDLFYEFVMMANKYIGFENQMVGHLNEGEDKKVFALLEQGAIPSSIVLCDAIFYERSTELLIALLNTAPMLLDQILNYALGEDAAIEVLKVLVDAGGIPTENSVAIAIERKCRHKKLVFLLNSGVVPTAKLLKLAIDNHLPEKTILALWEACPTPSSELIDLAIFSQYHVLIARMVEVMVQKEIVLEPFLLRSALFLSNNDAIMTLLNAGIEVTEEIVQQAKRSHISPEALTAIKKAYLRKIDPMEALPSDVIQRLISFLDDSAKCSTLEVNKTWNRAVSDHEKLEWNTWDFEEFVTTIVKNLPEIYTDQKEALSTLLANVSQHRTYTFCTAVFPFGSIAIQQTNIEINERIEGYKNQLKRMLLSLESEHLDAMFDAFKGKTKPAFYYEFVSLSKKYMHLSSDLNQAISLGNSEKIMKLLDQGAVSTTQILNYALHCQAPPEILTALLNANPFELNLNALLNKALELDASIEICTILIRSGASAESSHIITALQKRLSHEKILFLLEAGAAPTTNELARATINNTAQEETVLAFLEGGAVPSSFVLCQTIFNGYSEEITLRMIRAMQKRGLCPQSNVLEAAIYRRVSPDVMNALFDAGAELTKGIIEQAARVGIFFEVYESDTYTETT